MSKPDLISLSLQQLALAKQKIRENEAVLSENKHLLHIQQDNNKDLERQIAATKKQSDKLLQDVKEQETNLIGLQDEVRVSDRAERALRTSCLILFTSGSCVLQLKSYKNTLNRCSSDLKSLMSTIARRNKELNKNKEKSVKH